MAEICVRPTEIEAPTALRTNLNANRTLGISASSTALDAGLHFCKVRDVGGRKVWFFPLKRTTETLLFEARMLAWTVSLKTSGLDGRMSSEKELACMSLAWRKLDVILQPLVPLCYYASIGTFSRT